MPELCAKSEQRRFVFEPTRKPWLRRLTANGQYYLWWKHKQKRHQFKLNTDDYSTAVARGEEEIRNIKAQSQATPLANDGKATLGDILEHFLHALRRQVESKAIKQTSYCSIEDGVTKIERERADWLVRPAAKITEKEIDDYVHGIRAAQSPTTVNKVVDAFKRSYDLAVEDQFLAVNPTAKLKRPQQVEEGLLPWKCLCHQPTRYGEMHSLRNLGIPPPCFSKSQLVLVSTSKGSLLGKGSALKEERLRYSRTGRQQQ